MIRRIEGGLPSFIKDDDIKRVKEPEKPKDVAKKLLFKEAQKDMNLIDHGFGTFENSDTGTIWYRDGDYIYLKEDKETEAVLRYMKEEK